MGSGDGADGGPSRRLSPWMATALVAGNIIGSGVYLLPASLAPYGANGLVAWLFTAAGALALAAVFAALSRAFPVDGGPYVYTRAAFGERAAFVVAWGYWVSVWTGNAAIATAAVSYTSALVPWVAGSAGASAAATVAAVWLLTLVNCRGVRAAGWVQAVTTAVKLLPLAAVTLVGGAFVWGQGGAALADVPLSLGGTTAAATLTLWAMLGLESATVPAGKVEDAARTVPRATLVGTVVAVLFCTLACSVVLLVVPASRLAASTAPFAEAARVFWGEGASALVALFAALSAYGALNGWILVQGELPAAMARDGVFPRRFARDSARGTPAFALVTTSGLVTLLVLAGGHRGLVPLFTFMVLLATTACLVAYLASSLALLALARRGRLARRGQAGLAAAAALGAAYSLWAIAGAGREAALWGLVLMLAAVPVHAAMKRNVR
jgi:APA family basic amino acid/polyamine antiporter